MANMKLYAASACILAAMLLLGCTLQSVKVPNGQLPDGTYWRGSEKPSVTVFDYSDFECPACKSAVPAVESFIAKYSSKGVRLVYRHFPLEDIHPQARLSAIASECAAREGKFWEYHDLLYEKSPLLSRENLIAYANSINLSSKFSACLDDSSAAAKVDSEVASALSLGLRGTPSFVVNDIVITGGNNLEGQLSQAADRALGG